MPSPAAKQPAVTLPAQPEALTEALKTVTHLYRGTFLGDPAQNSELVDGRMRDALNLQTIFRATQDPENYKLNRKERRALFALKEDGGLQQKLQNQASDIAVDIDHYDIHFQNLMKAIAKPPTLQDVERAARGAKGIRNMLSFGMNYRNAQHTLAKFVAVELAEEALALINEAHEQPASSPTNDSLHIHALERLNSAVYTLSQPRMFAPLIREHRDALTNIQFTPFHETLAQHGFIRDEHGKAMAPEPAGQIINAVLMMKTGNRIRHIVRAIPDNVTPEQLPDVAERLSAISVPFSDIPMHEGNHSQLQELRAVRALVSGFTHAIIHSDMPENNQVEALQQIRYFGQSLVTSAYKSAYGDLAISNDPNLGNMEHVTALRGRIADFILLQEHGSDLRHTSTIGTGQSANVRNAATRLMSAMMSLRPQLGMDDNAWQQAQQWLSEGVGISLSTVESMLSAQHLSSAAQRETVRASQLQQPQGLDAEIAHGSTYEDNKRPIINLDNNPFAKS